MPRSEDVIVVGAGLAGVAAAYELARRGRSVRLLEALDGAALATSYANGGMLTPSMADPWNAPGVGRRLAASLFDPAAALKLRPSAMPSLTGWGLRFLRNATPARHRAATLAAFRLAELSRRTTIDLRRGLALAYEHAERGTMKVFRERAVFESQVALAGLMRAEGLSAEVLDAEGVIAAEPLLAPIRGKVLGGLRYPQDEVGDAHMFTRELADRFVAAGGVFATGIQVRALLKRSGRVTGVRADHGDELARSVVIAAGTASPALLRQVGIPLPVRPAKGYSLTYAAGAVPILPRLPVVDEALHAAVAPIGGRLRVVGFAEFAGDDRSIPAARIAALRAVFAALYPDLARAADDLRASAWAGLRPMSADGLPFIGATRLPGLWLNTGHGHLGWTMAAGSARVLADLMDGRASPIDPTPYRADR